MTESKVKEYFIKRTTDKALLIDSIDDNGLYHIQANGFEVSVSLENIILNSIRDNSLSPVDALIESLMLVGTEKKDLNTIKNNIYPSLENVDVILGDEIQENISDQVKKCYYVFVNNNIIYITNEDLTHWKITVNELQSFASNNLDNLDNLYKSVSIQYQEIENHKLYCIETDFPLKSTILFSEQFKTDYIRKFKSDIIAVFPCRDFCYFFSEQDKDYFLSRIGGIVTDEFNKSGYSISKEVFVLSRDSNTAIGSY